MPKQPKHEPIPCPDCDDGWVSTPGFAGPCERCEGSGEWRPTPEMLQHVIVSRPRMHGKARFLREGEAWDAVIDAAFGTAEQPISDAGGDA